MKITTLPVYSKLADEDSVPPEVRAKLPLGWRLSQHQVETYKALTSGEYDVVFNTAMTGDGKSLAAYLRTLASARSVFAMYPTNELARDQELQLEKSKQEWHCDALRVTPMSANRLGNIVATGTYSRKADVIRHLTDNNDVVLTNPDIFHYLAQFFYTRKGDAPDMLFSRKIVELFDLFVFDEFHIFQTPQVVAVLNAMLLVREVSGTAFPKHFLFLSATPDPLLHEYLGKAGFRAKFIQPEAQGRYLHTTAPVDRADWRPIVQATDLYFWETKGDYLVFESRDAGTFLQRLGRLGRHTDDGRGQRFEAFEAHALAPNFVRERLFEGNRDRPALLPEMVGVSRSKLSEAIREAYPPPASFKSYAREWGWVQSAHVYYKLCNKTVRDSYETARANLKQYYWDVLGISTGRALGEYKELMEEARQIAEEAQSFRGGSPFECGVIDPAEPGADSVKRYDLLNLAANAEVDWLGQEQFTQEAAQRGVALAPTAIEQMAGWFRFRQFSPKRRAVTIHLRDAVGTWSAEMLGEPQVIDGVELDVPGVDWLNDINPHLRRRKFVVTLCLIPPNDLRYRLRLPPMFELLAFVARDGTTGSIAFAREALLLSVALKERRVECGGGAVIV